MSKIPKEVKKKIKKYHASIKKVTKKVLAKKLGHSKTIKNKKMAEKTGIDKSMIISDVIEKYPEAIRVFFKYDITCVGCFLANSETLEQGAEAHGINLDEFIKDIEEEINK